MNKLDELKTEHANLLGLREVVEAKGQSLSRTKAARLVFLTKLIHELEA